MRAINAMTLLLALLMGGCGSKSSDQTVAKTIAAAQGGTIAAADGATLVIPAGALSADTSITLTVSTSTAGLPDGDSLMGTIYDFGPAATQFQPPATLTIPLGAAPSHKHAVISWLDTAAGAWSDLGTTASGSMATAQVAHFTTFAPRWLDDSSCPDTASFIGSCVFATNNVGYGLCWDVYAPDCSLFRAQFETTCSAQGVTWHSGAKCSGYTYCCATNEPTNQIWMGISMTIAGCCTEEDPSEPGICLQNGGARGKCP